MSVQNRHEEALEAEIRRLRAENLALRSYVRKGTEPRRVPTYETAGAPARPAGSGVEPQDVTSRRGTRRAVAASALFRSLAVVLMMLALGLVGILYAARGTAGLTQERVIVLVSAAIVSAALTGWTHVFRQTFPQVLLGLALGGLHGAAYWLAPTETSNGFASAAARAILISSLALVFAVPALLRAPRAAIPAGLSAIATLLAAATIYRYQSPPIYVPAGLAVLIASSVWFLAGLSWRGCATLTAAAAYLLAAILLRNPSMSVPMSESAAFWAYTCAAAVLFVALDLAALTDAVRSNGFARRHVVLVGLNSLLFIAATLGPYSTRFPGYPWAYAAVAGLLHVALAASIVNFGPTARNPRGLLLTIAVAIFTLGIMGMSSPAKVWGALALEGFILVGAYGLLGWTALKMLSLLVMVLALAGCLPEATLPGYIGIFGFTIPTNWFCCSLTSVCFLASAWLYQQIARFSSPGADRGAPHPLRFAPADTSAAMIHAGAAALLLTAPIVHDFHSRPEFPFILGLMGVLLFGLGVVTRNAPIQTSGVLMLIAGHTAYLILMGTGRAGFADQTHFPAFSAALITAAFLAAFSWERFLNRVQAPHTVFHYAVASIPALVAVSSSIGLIRNMVEPEYTPLAQNALGIVLLFLGAVTRYAGPSGAAIVALVSGTSAYFSGLHAGDSPAPQLLPSLAPLAGVLGSYAVAERILFFCSARRRSKALPGAEGARTALVATAGMLGVLALNQLAPEERLTLFWLALAACGLSLGAVFHDTRYVWASLFIFGIAGIRGLLHDFPNLPLIYQVLSFAALIVFLVWTLRAFLHRRAPPKQPLRPAGRHHDPSVPR